LILQSGYKLESDNLITLGKTGLLAITLGLILVFSVASTPQAFAATIIIDNFEFEDDDTDDFTGACDEQLKETAVRVKFSNTDPGLMGVIGDGDRECDFNLDADVEPPSFDVGNVMVDGGQWSYGTEPDVNGDATLKYDNGVMLNLEGQIGIRVVCSFADSIIPITVIITDGAGSGSHKAQVAGSCPDNTNAPINLDFMNGAFLVNNALIDLDDIVNVTVAMEPPVAGDYVFDEITSPMEMVGGEMFPVDTSALLLAGAKLNAMWILPTIAAIAIGGFLVTRLRK